MSKIQIRRDTAANFTSANPVLSVGEPSFETDTGVYKIGDGVTAYNSLPIALTRTFDTRYDLSGNSTHTNIRYVSTTGNDANTGLSWAQAKKTVAAAVNALPANGGKVIMGPGQINIGAAITLNGANPNPQSASWVIEGQSDFLTQVLPKDANGNPLTGLTALFTVNNTYNVRFRNFMVNYQAVAAATTTYIMLQTGPTHSPEGLYEEVYLLGTANSTYGFAVWSAATADVSGTTYIKCQAQGFSNGAGWLLGNGTAVANIYNVRALACDSFSNKYGVYQNNCTFNWMGGTVEANTTADFHSDFVGGGPTIINGCRSEGSARFWECTTGSNIQGPVYIVGCTATTFTDPAGKVISHRSGVPLILNGFQSTQGSFPSVWDIGTGNSLHPVTFVAMGCTSDVQQPFPNAGTDIVRTVLGQSYFDGTYFSPSTLRPVIDNFTELATTLLVGSAATGNIRLAIGGTNAGSQVLDFRSSGNTNTYDSRLLATGGSASNGTGSLQVSAAALYMNCPITPNADNTYDSGASALNWRNIYAKGFVKVGTFATASRPASPPTGAHVFDTTLNKPIWYNGTAWVDATGTTV